ncbi:MAG: DUF1553 domain-containing protein [Pirellulaceae bacterium]
MTKRMRRTFSMLCIGTCLLLCDRIMLAAEPVKSSPPVARWTFDDQETVPSVGAVRFDGTGPRSPVYPGFAKDNKSLVLEAPAWLRIPDEKEDSRFDFDNGDAITLEAWVKPGSIPGQHVYIIAKGRTEASGPRGINQNWALRLRKQKGMIALNFLFRSRPDADTPGDWHRWTSTTGLASGSRWHHIAVSYQFGKPESIRGYLDGKQVQGKWDMGGATTRAPVVDNDEVRIGSAYGGLASVSFDGSLDEIAIHRRIVSPEELKSRFQWDPPEQKPPQIPRGKVVVQLFGPINSTAEFPRYLETPRIEWQQDVLAFTRLPHHYDDWGIRKDWGQTVLMKAWAEVELSAGQHELLIRSRGMSRLSIDGKVLLTTGDQKSRGSAHNEVDDLAPVPVPGMRPHWMNDREAIGSFTSKGGRHRVLFEAIVGGPSFRLELGESVVAIARPDEMFHLLSEKREYSLTDHGWAQFREMQRQALEQLDQHHRQQANQLQAAYWNRRHEQARKVLLEKTGSSSIDQLIAKRIATANGLATSRVNAPQDDRFYRQQVEPILRAHCFRCHVDKQKGELSLQSRQRLLQGGASGLPAVVPGKPGKSYLFELITAGADEHRMPPRGAGLDQQQQQTLKRWITQGAVVHEPTRATVQPTPIVDDYTFLRRIFMDSVGVPPTLQEARQFLQDTSAGRRARLVDRLLHDSRWADNWVGYWQDVLAENPNLLKPKLNNTGPFRWWIHEALVDNKPIDRFATELILMRGSTWGGGSAGFAIASENDVPMAAKAHVVASAFLGVNMKCARCHDAPYHQWKQSDLFHMAAMLNRQPIKLPSSSTVPAAFFEKQQRAPLIDATLRSGTVLAARWPFENIKAPVTAGLLMQKDDTRDRLAVEITASRRFAEVIANRLWARFMGQGLVSPVDDWEDNPPSNPELLALLADELIRHDYDARELARVIFNSQAYQRKAIDLPQERGYYFQGPYRRRLTAEQIVDSAFHVVGQQMKTEPLTLDIEGTYDASRFLHFGYPRRAWEFTTMGNERDRPSLAIPRVQAIADVLKAFGWRNARPEPTSEREESPNLLQPGVLANGTVGVWLTRLSDDSGITKMALQSRSVESLVDDLFLRLLTRLPTQSEKEQFVSELSVGYTDRVIPGDQVQPAVEPKRFRHVSWSNHLSPDANSIKIELQELARSGDPPTRFLRPAWRERMEDAVWALFNNPEMILVP